MNPAGDSTSTPTTNPSGFSFSGKIFVDGQLVTPQKKYVIDAAEMQEKEIAQAGKWYENEDNFTPQTQQVAGEKNDIQAALEELNADKIEPNTRMSQIDMRTHLSNTEISAIVAFDTLINLRFLPVSVSGFTRQKKRLAVSLGGRGREQIVNIVAGAREMQGKLNGGGLIDRFKAMWGGGQK